METEPASLETHCIFIEQWLNRGWMFGRAIMKHGISGLAACLLAVAASNAVAQTKAQIEAGKPCFDLKSSADQRLIACNVVIASKTKDKRILSSAYSTRSIVYLSKREPDLAIRDGTEAIRNNPTSALAYVARGDAYADTGDYDRAIDDYSRAISIMPQKDPYTYMSRAIAYEGKSEFQKSIADLDTTIQLKPNYSEAFLYRGFVYGLLKKHDKAVENYSTVIRLKPDDYGAYFRRGEIYAQLGDDVRAVADLTEAIRLKPDYTDAFMIRGGLYFKEAALDEALKDYGAAIRLDPSRAVTYVARAYVYDAKRDYDRAISDYDTALKLRPDLPGAAKSRELAITAREQVAIVQQPAVASTGAPNSKVAPDAASISRDHRVALVIGNSAYQAVAALPNPAKDIELVGDAMRRTGIDVTVVHDLDRAGMVNALKAFAEKADTAEWAMIYYAGHGIEVGGINYLIPVDAQLHNERDVPDEAVTLQRLLSATEGARRLRLVVLDACRNNPFAKQMKMATATRSLSRGLARIEPENGTLVVYAAKEGTTADDGAGANSPFAVSFAKRVAEPGVEINMTFRLVRQDVMKATGNQQEPFTYGSLPPEGLYFAGNR